MSDLLRLRRRDLSPVAAHRALQRGELQRIAPGVYRKSDRTAVDQDKLQAVALRPHATICLVSALAHHDLVDELPTSLQVALPRGTRIPKRTPTLTWHVFDPDTFELGRDLVTIDGSSELIELYSPERSIVDAFRLRGQVGYETARDALKEWLRRGGKPAEIAQLAIQIPRAKRPVFDALKVLS